MRLTDRARLILETVSIALAMLTVSVIVALMGAAAR
jgi:hypothetical protein